MKVMGKILVKVEKELYQFEVLVADVFEENTDLKIMFMVDGDKVLGNSLLDATNKAESICIQVLFLDELKTIKFTKPYLDIDYGQGTMLRMYMFIEDYETNYELTEIEGW